MSNPTPRPNGSGEELDALLRLLQRQPQAQPRPFFYERLHARLAAAQPPVGFWLPSWARRPAYLALLGMLVLAVSSDGATLHPVAAAGPLNTYPAASPAPTLPR